MNTEEIQLLIDLLRDAGEGTKDLVIVYLILPLIKLVLVLSFWGLVVRTAYKIIHRAIDTSTSDDSRVAHFEEAYRVITNMARASGPYTSSEQRRVLDALERGDT